MADHLDTKALRARYDEALAASPLQTWRWDEAQRQLWLAMLPAFPALLDAAEENARLVAALRGIVEGGCPCAEHDCEKCREAYRAARAALAEVDRG